MLKGRAAELWPTGIVGGEERGESWFAKGESTMSCTSSSFGVLVTDDLCSDGRDEPWMLGEQGE